MARSRPNGYAAPARGPRGPGPDRRVARRHHRHRGRRGGLRGRRAGVVRVADQPRPRARRHRRDQRGRARGRRLRRRRQHVRHPPAAEPAGAGRRHRGALGDEVPRRAQRRADRRGRRPTTTSCTPCSRAAATCWARCPGTLEAWLALRGLRTLHLRVERAQANAAGARPAAAGAPRARRGALPGLRRDRLGRAGAGRDGRRPAHPQDAAVGARHLPRRRRVDVRAPAPLEGRAGHHPRRPGPALGRHRGRRRPVGRPARRRSTTWSADSRARGGPSRQSVSALVLPGDERVHHLLRRSSARRPRRRRARRSARRRRAAASASSEWQDFAPSAT